MGMINGALSILCAIFSFLLILTLQFSRQWRYSAVVKPATMTMVFVFLTLLCAGIAFLLPETEETLFNVLLTTSNAAAYGTEWFFGVFIVSQVKIPPSMKRNIKIVLGVLCLIGIVLYIINGIHPIFFDYKSLQVMPINGYWSFEILNYLFFIFTGVLLLFRGGSIPMRDRILPVITQFLPLTSLIWDSIFPGLYSWDLLSFIAIAANLIHLVFILANQAQEKVDELEVKRIRATLERIKPHYIYNVLASIYYLCDQDVSTAKEAIQIFSDYLRDVLNMMEEQTLIPVSRELKTVRNYLELEQMRFGDRIHVRYQTEIEDFLIPPFSLQPLVENSVKHGLANAEGDGEIVIITYDRPESYVIVVKDSFEGFDTEQTDAGGGSGTKYVREILHRTVNGTLQIKSKPGDGTISMITIPKKQ